MGNKMNRIVLDLSEECYEDIANLIESLAGKKKAAAFRVLTQRKEEAEKHPEDKKAKARLSHAEEVAGLKKAPTIIRNYKMSETPKEIS